jgi:hypothetical protein
MLLNNLSIRLALSALSTLIQIIRTLRHHRRIRNMSFHAAVRRDENVEPAGDHKATEEEEEDNVAYAETQDM